MCKNLVGEYIIRKEDVIKKVFSELDCLVSRFDWFFKVRDWKDGSIPVEGIIESVELRVYFSRVDRISIKEHFSLEDDKEVSLYDEVLGSGWIVFDESSAYLVFRFEDYPKVEMSDFEGTGLSFDGEKLVWCSEVKGRLLSEMFRRYLLNKTSCIDSYFSRYGARISRVDWGISSISDEVANDLRDTSVTIPVDGEEDIVVKVGCAVYFDRVDYSEIYRGLFGGGLNPVKKDMLVEDSVLGRCLVRFDWYTAYVWLWFLDYPIIRHCDLGGTGVKYNSETRNWCTSIRKNELDLGWF